jgi:ketosteroid isomerase-like protein
LVLLAACGAKKEKEPAPEAKGAVDAAAVVAKAAVDAAPAAPKDPAESEAAALLEAWKAAQDGGDFGAYEKLYHREFEGVRRSGKETKTLDRAAWMRDRKKMFAKPMTAEVADLKVVKEGDTLALTFTQTWTSGTYRDRGTKVMKLAKEAAAWRIQREEMLDSTILPITTPDAGVPVVAAAGADAGPEPGPTLPSGDPSIAKVTFGLSDAPDVAHLELALVDDDEVLLALSDVDFGKGPLEVLEKFNSYGNGPDSWAHSQREVGDTLPAALAAAKGAAVVVLDEELAPICQGTLGAPTYLEIVEGTESSDDDEIPRQTWLPGPYTVRVELEAGCSGTYVRAAALPALVVRKPDKKAAKKLAKAAKKAARSEHRGAEPEITIVSAPDGTLFAAAGFEIEDTCGISDAGWHFMLSSSGSWAGTDTQQEDSLHGAVDLGSDGDIDVITGRGSIDTGDTKGGFHIWRPDMREPMGEAGCDGDEGD